MNGGHHNNKLTRPSGLPFPVPSREAAGGPVQRGPGAGFHDAAGGGSCASVLLNPRGPRAPSGKPISLTDLRSLRNEMQSTHPSSRG